MLPEMSNKELDRLAAEFRCLLVELICRVKWGHLGGTLSLTEILITLYFRVMRLDAKNPKWPDRDRFVLSKGHAGPMLYITLAYKGFFPKRDLLKLNTNDSNLPSHCDRLRTTGVDMSAGSLGQGISCACGMAKSAKIDGKSHNVFCIIGDGESNEGQVWEAAMFAGHNKLDNLVVICDRNRLQVDGFTDDICTLEPFKDKWQAFNWEVFEIDGHNWDELYSSINNAIEVKNKPAIIIANTKKAKGHRDYENRTNCHSVRVPDEQAAQKMRSGVQHVEIDWLK